MSSRKKGSGLWSYVRLPFDRIRSSYYLLRKHLFQSPRPAGPYFLVKEPLPVVEAALGRQAYAPNWAFSYYKRGEVLNLAHVVYDHQSIGGRVYEWWQIHVRGWESDEGIELQAHYELEPTENDNDHIDGVGYSVEEGMTHLRAALEAAELDYEERHVDPKTVVEREIPIEH